MRQLWDFLDGELTPDRMKAIEAHLAGCEHCLSRAAFERAFLNAVARAMQDALPQAPDLGGRARAVLRAEGFTAG